MNANEEYAQRIAAARQRAVEMAMEQNAAYARAEALARPVLARTVYGAMYHAFWGPVGDAVVGGRE